MASKTSAGIVLGGGINPKPVAHRLIKEGHFVSNITPKCIEFSKNPEDAFTLTQFDHREVISAWAGGEPMEIIGLMASSALIQEL